MPRIGITGGIASGKSSFRNLLLERVEGEFFDTDRCGHELLNRNTDVRERVAAEISPEAFSADGDVNRAFLRRIVFEDDAMRRSLESILHPIIRNRWTAAAARATGVGRNFFVEIPLLFETGAETELDLTVLVACPATLQLRRLERDRHMPTEIARKILASQLGLEVKMRRSDHIVWNDGPPRFLEAQAELFAALLNSPT